MIMLMLFAFSFGYAQEVQNREMPPKHRGMHPRLQADGTVVDDNGKTLGSIKNGKVCDEAGKVIGVISGHGDLTTARGKSIGKMQKDGSFKSMKGHVVTTDPDGVVKVAGKEVARVEAGYKDLAWATGYNVIALPLATGILYNAGIMLSPAVGAVLMSVSTIVVAINAGMLKIK